MQAPDVPVQPSSDIPDRIMRKLYAYWADKRGSRKMPSRADIDPAEIVPLLPHLMLVDVHHEADGQHRHYFRLVGTQVAFGKDPTGTYLEDQVGDSAYGAHIITLYSQASALGRPLYSEYEYEHPETHGVRHAKRLFLPLADDGNTVTKMMVGQRVEATSHLEKSLWQIRPEMIHRHCLFQVGDNIS